jgi:hypothetical protein
MSSGNAVAIQKKLDIPFDTCDRLGVSLFRDDEGPGRGDALCIITCGVTLVTGGITAGD